MLFVAMRLLCLCFCLGFLFQVVEWGMGGFGAFYVVFGNGVDVFVFWK